MLRKFLLLCMLCLGCGPATSADMPVEGFDHCIEGRTIILVLQRAYKQVAGTHVYNTKDFDLNNPAGNCLRLMQPDRVIDISGPTIGVHSSQSSGSELLDFRWDGTWVKRYGGAIRIDAEFLDASGGLIHTKRWGGYFGQRFEGVPAGFCWKQSGGKSGWELLANAPFLFEEVASIRVTFTAPSGRRDCY